MTLADILDIIFKRIKILVIIPMIFFCASMFYAFEMVSPTYTATTTFMVLNQTYYDSITYNDLMIGEVLINDYKFLQRRLRFTVRLPRISTTALQAARLMFRAFQTPEWSSCRLQAQVPRNRQTLPTLLQRNL